MVGGLRAFAIRCRFRFRGITVREGALIEGPAGWGEFSPFAEYGPKESARWLASALESAMHSWPAPVRDRIPVNVTVPAVGPEQAFKIVAGSGCRTAEGQGGRARPVRGRRHRAGRGGPRGRWGRTARSGSTPTAAGRPGQAVRMLRQLARFGLEYAEQPCATLEELAELRRQIDIPVAADESIRQAEDPLRVRAAGAADIVMLKVQPLGGVRAALAVAEACGLPVVVSSAVDTSVGLGRRVALAASLPELAYAAAWARCRCWPGRHGEPAGARGRGTAGPAAARRSGPAGPLGNRSAPVAGAGRVRRPFLAEAVPRSAPADGTSHP